MVAELVCTDKNERVNALLELLDARQGLQFATSAFTFHRHGDDTHGQDTLVLGQLGHDRCRTSACAATHTGGDKQHLGVVIQERFNFATAHLGGFTSNVGVVAGTEFALAKVHGSLHLALQQSLMVGVAKDEVNPLNALFHHVVDSVAATATHTNDFDVVGLCLIDGFEHLAVAVVDICVVFCHNFECFKG